MPPDPELVKLVSYIHRLAVERGDNGVIVVSELAAEYLFSQAKEVVPAGSEESPQSTAIDVMSGEEVVGREAQQPTLNADERPPAMYSPPGADMQLLAQFSEVSADLAEARAELARIAEERDKKASAARSAQMKYRGRLAAKKKNGKQPKVKQDVREGRPD